MIKKPDGFILWHVDGLMSFKAFDVFVRKGKIRKFKKEFDWLYKTDCLFAEIFQKVFKDYKYIGSEDDLHIYPINLRVPKGFKEIFLHKFYPGDIKEARKMIKQDLEKIKEELEKRKRGKR